MSRTTVGAIVAPTGCADKLRRRSPRVSKHYECKTSRKLAPHSGQSLDSISYSF